MQIEGTPFNTFIFHALFNAILKSPQNAQCKDAKKPTHHATAFSPEYCTNREFHKSLSTGRLITKTTNKPQTYDLHVFKESVIFVNSGI